MMISIVYEDQDLMVIDKPWGIVVNKADTARQETIQDWVEQKLQLSNNKIKVDEGNDFYNRGGIVHRLDKDTSGLLVIAKNPKSFIFLQNQFKERGVSKVYKTLVHGRVIPETGTIKASVGRLPWNRERFGVLAGGRTAETSYKVIGYYTIKKDLYSFLEVHPLTGRTHQIRIHLKYIGHSVVGDSFYAGRKTFRNDNIFCPRLFLHASSLSIKKLSGEMLDLQSPLFPDLQVVLNSLNLVK